MTMRVALLNIGGELLDGRTTNTNASYFAGELKRIGASVAEVRMVEDAPAAIADALRDLQKYAEIIVTGGLGPTADDITAEVAAHTFESPQVYHPSAEQMIRAKLTADGQPYTDTQRRQAYLPQAATIIANDWGIAPGFSLAWEGAQYSFLPGVPRECRPMLMEKVLPRIRERLGKNMQVIASYHWRCFGEREATIYKWIGNIIEDAEKKFGEHFSFSSLIPFPEVHLRVEFWRGRTHGRVSSAAERTAFAHAIDAAIAAQVRDGGTIVFSREPVSLVEAVVRVLQSKNSTCAIAESCTGGLLGNLFTELPGVSQVFVGGVISYSNELKTNLLGVPGAWIRREGAVSEAVALAMAAGARERLQSTYGIAITGVAGPDGGTDAKPVGTTWVAVAGPSRTVARHVWIKNGNGTRNMNRLYAAHFALKLLWDELYSAIELSKN